MTNTRKHKGRPMKDLLHKVKKFFNWIGIAVLIIIGIIKGKEIYEKNNSSTDTPESITDDITERGITRFRDRTGESIRRVFDNRGHKPSTTDSGRRDNQDSTGSEGGIDNPLPSRDTETRSTEPNLSNNLNNIGICIGRNTPVSVSPLDLFDPDLLNHIEGALFKNKGSKLLCLLAPLQLVSRRLTVQELVEIYRQGVKDPSIITRSLQFGTKAEMLTYHAMRILNSKMYLKSVEPTASERFPVHHYEITGWDTGDKVMYTLNDCTQEEIFDPALGTYTKEVIYSRSLYRIVN